MRVSKKSLGTDKKSVYALLAAVFAVSLSACTDTTVQERNLSAVVAYYLEQKYPEYSYRFVDLNNDAVDDAIVFLQGSSWCGPDGCTMLVLQGEGEGFKVVSKVSEVLAPVRVSETLSHAWRDIIVHSNDEEKLLQFDGSDYPPKAAEQPTAPTESLDSVAIIVQ